MFVAPFVATPAALEINGTCETGGTSCSSVVPLLLNDSVGTTPFSFTVSVNDDPYLMSGTYAASYTSAAGTILNLTLNATYTGDGPTSVTDILTLDLLQNFFNSSVGNWDGVYSESVPVNIFGDVGDGTNATAQFLVDGQSVGSIGPFGPGSNLGQASKNLSELGGNTLTQDFNFVFTFEPGTDPGAGSVVSATPNVVPEPSSLLLFGFGLASVLTATRARRKQSRTQ
jgi:hypothetical protein